MLNGLLQMGAFRLETLHNMVFGILYIMAALTTFVAVERGLFLWFAYRNAAKLERALLPGTRSFAHMPDRLLGAHQPAAIAVCAVRARAADIASRGDLEDITDAAFIGARDQLRRRLWILDTVITAAPLLGLLGTILGIIDTFSTLAQSGVSDPSAVSRGIGVALYATAVGIATALYALLLHNVIQARVTQILDTTKIILMRLSFLQPDPRTASPATGAQDLEAYRSGERKTKTA